jgi:DNA-binding transcriptional regulator of glucitol operon
VVRVLLAPRWLLGHLTLLLAVWASVLLSRWQWDRGAAEYGSARNYLYAVQWIVFGALAIYGWGRAVLDQHHGVSRATVARPVTGGPDRYVDRPLIDDSDDPELAAWNAMLARKAQGSR